MKNFLSIGLAAILMVAQPLRAAEAPDFTLPTPEGSVSLADLRGKAVYLDFWASWCPPCKKSFPWMNSIAKRYEDEGLVVLAVNLDKKRELATEFLNSVPARFPIAFDPKGEVASRYQLPGMPTSFLIDRNGDLVGRHVGFREGDKADMEQSIRALLEKGGSAQ